MCLPAWAQGLRGDSWAQGPAPGQTCCCPDPPFLFAGQSLLESPVSGPRQSLSRPLLLFLLPVPRTHMFPGSPSSVPLSLQPVSPVPPPRVCHSCPRLSAPSHISPRDGTALHPSPQSAWRSHAPGAGVTLQADTLSWKTSTPRLCLLVDTRLPPPPGACARARAGAAGLARRGGMAGTGQSPRASPGRGVQRGSSTGRSRARARALSRRTTGAPGLRGC